MQKDFCYEKEGKIIITCKCLEIGESCTDSLFCCSGYCNRATNACDVSPVCPEDWMKCPGAIGGGGAGDNAWIDRNGEVCCPIDNIDDISGPVCSDSHCCPTHKPQWCNRPIAGNPRCMDASEYGSNCEKGFPIIYIPLNYGQNEFDIFRSNSEEFFTDFAVEYAPSKECSDPLSVFQTYYLDPSKCMAGCSNPCTDCINVVVDCVINNYQDVINDASDYMIVGVCKDSSCSAGGMICGCSILFSRVAVDNSLCGSDSGAHEMGHSVGFNHVDHICDDPAGACQGINAGDCSDPNKQQDLMTYCKLTRSRFGNIAYDYLKNTIFKDYLVGC